MTSSTAQGLNHLPGPIVLMKLYGILIFVIFGIAFYILSHIVLAINYKNNSRWTENRLVELCHLFLYGSSDKTTDLCTKKDAESEDEEKTWTKARKMKLLMCFLGLNTIYVIWGLAQERIMTLEYDTNQGTGPTKLVRFKTSEFVVLSNRIGAFIMSLIFLIFVRIRSRSPNEQERRHYNGPAIYRHSFSSIFNVLSSFSQYEALKYVNFPTQVLAKCCKMIPVMMVGRILFGRKYSIRTYIMTIFITFGVAIYMFGADTRSRVQKMERTENTNIIIPSLTYLAGYLLFDSLASNYQEKLFREYPKMDSLEASTMTSIFSVAICSFSLAFSNHLEDLFLLLKLSSQLRWHLIVTSICSGLGQLLIFWTIRYFGALIFSGISITRQAISILLSNILFQHGFSFTSMLGILMVFSGLLFDKYLALKMKFTNAIPSKDARSIV